MKIAAFGDMHAHLFEEFAEDLGEESGNTRLQQILDALEFMREYCLDNGIQLVLFAGDLYHKRGAVHTTVQNMVRDEIGAFGTMGINMIMIPGNHDQVDNSDYPHHSLHSYKQFEHVKVLDRFLPYPYNNGEEKALIFPSPYSKNAVLVKEKLNKYKEMVETTYSKMDYPRILLGHLGLSGAFVGKGNYSMADAFTVEDLHPDSYMFGVFGHFHKRQLLGGRENFFYTGAPVQHSFNDEGEDKGFMVLDTDTGKAEFVPISAPKFITVKEADLVSLVEGELNGNFIRLQINADKVENVVNQIPPGLKYRVEPQKTFTEDKRVDVDFSMSHSEIVSNYAKEKMPEAEKLGLEILREAESL